MKVLQIIDRLDAGGAERVFLDQLQGLKDSPLELGAMVLRKGGVWFSRIPESIPVYVLDRPSKWSLYKLWELHRVCAQYDLIHAHMRHVYAYVRAARMLFRGNYRILIQDHLGVGDLDTVPWQLNGLFRPEYYLAVDPRQLRWARHYLGLDGNRSFLLENQPLWAPPLPRRPPAAPPSALLISNIYPGKNLDFALRLFQRRQERLTIYGQVRDPAYYRKLKALISSCDKIEIITDGRRVPFEDHDLGLHCSSRESGPLVLWEYLAHGLPFLAFPTGSASDRIRPRFPEFFLDRFDLETWSDRLDQIRERKEWKTEARGFFMENHRPKDYFNACLSIYHRVAY